MVADPNVFKSTPEDDDGPFELLQVGTMLPHVLLALVDDVVDGLLELADVLI